MKLSKFAVAVFIIFIGILLLALFVGRTNSLMQGHLVEQLAEDENIHQHLQSISLFDRIGGLNTIYQIIDKLANSLKDDAELTGMSDRTSGSSSNQRLTRTVQYFCQLTGGPCVYEGRPLKEVHRNMHISNELFDKGFKYFKETVNEFSFGRQEKIELFALVESLRSDIVSQ